MQATEHTRTAARGERLNARISPETKALFQKAAKIQGRSVTDFVIHSASDAAKRTVQENEIWELSYRDRLAFAEALLNPAPEPNAKLIEAAKRHAQLFPG
jgi:uncharacterized protein (DUF1778 family)